MFAIQIKTHQGWKWVQRLTPMESTSWSELNKKVRRFASKAQAEDYIRKNSDPGMVTEVVKL